MDGLIWQLAIKWGHRPIASLMVNSWICNFVSRYVATSQNVWPLLKIFRHVSRHLALYEIMVCYVVLVCKNISMSFKLMLSRFAGTSQNNTPLPIHPSALNYCVFSFHASNFGWEKVNIMDARSLFVSDILLWKLRRWFWMRKSREGLASFGCLLASLFLKRKVFVLKKNLLSS